MPASEVPSRPSLVSVPADDGLSSLDERALVERARTDPRAFALLYHAYVGRIYAFAWRRSRSKELAEDVTAATFERALRGLDHFQWKGSGFGPWLYRIAAHELADHYRRASVERSERAQGALVGLGDSPATDDLESVEGHADERVQAMLAALSTLHPRYQEAISLRWLAGLSADEAAQAMGCTKPVMAVTLHRAMASLRRVMVHEAETVQEGS